MPDEVLLASRDARGALTLTLNRPEQRNALDPALTHALLDALRAAERDDDVRCVVLAGAGPAFCAGGDLRNMQERRGKPHATLARQRDAFAPLAKLLLALEKPTVARVHGDAAGAGAALAMACDFALASEAARFTFAFARVGLVPDTGATWLLPRLVGLRRARELALLPEPVEAQRAAELGLVTASVPAGELDARVEDVVARLAAGPTRALGLARRALAEGAGSSLDAALAREAELQALCFTLDDHAEGVDAVLEKRAPRFTGR